MRFVYSVPTRLAGLPRPYLRLRVNSFDMPAPIDTGADVSVIPEREAPAAGIDFDSIDGAGGIGGLVSAFRARHPVAVTLLAPHGARRGIRWVPLGTPTIRPLVIPFVIPSDGLTPALVGRTDVLVRYLFTLREYRQIFELSEAA